MMYEKPEVDVVAFDFSEFMTSSGSSPVSYNSAQEALTYTCGGYNGGSTNNFSCNSFGGYSAANPPTQNAQVTIEGTTYVFDYKGNHWKQHKGN